MLADPFGREITGVRVSLTDRCNFDCVYCHNEGIGDTRGPEAPQDHEMDTDDVMRFLEVAAEYDVQSVKFTGGEPLLRTDIADIIRRVPADLETSMTTNGSMLDGRAQDLADAGLERVNVSQDAVDPDAFAAVTGTGAYDVVVEGVEAALDAGLAPVKLNMVVFEETAGYVPDMVEHVAAGDGLQLQLIEYMPEIAGNPEWAVDIDRVHDWLADRADRIETRRMHERRRYYIDGGMVEIVDPVGNEEFCANCHRLRVAHDGRLSGCLNRSDDWRSMGAMTRPEIRAAFEDVVRDRVPFYGEYMVERDGEWVANEAYQ